jgi:hypothetical protein
MYGWVWRALREGEEPQELGVFPLETLKIKSSWWHVHKLSGLLDRVFPRREPVKLLYNLHSSVRPLVPFHLVLLSFGSAYRRLKTFVWPATPSDEKAAIDVEKSSVGSIGRTRSILALDDISLETQFESGFP